MLYLKKNLSILYEQLMTYLALITLNYNYNFGIYALIVLDKFMLHKLKSEKKEIMSFFWLIGVVNMGENPESYDITGFFSRYYVFIFILILFLINVIRNKIKINTYINTKFWYLFENKINFRKLILFFIRFLIRLKIFFERDNKYAIAVLVTPNIIYIFDTLVHIIPYMDNPIVLAAVYFTFGFNLILFDSLSIKIFSYVDKEPLSRYLKDILIDMDKDLNLLDKGFLLASGKLSAAGQAAIYAGAFACVTGIAVAGVNGYISIQNTKQKYAYKTVENSAEREAAAAEKAAKRSYKTNQNYQNRDWDAYNKSWNPFKSKPPKP